MGGAFFAQVDREMLATTYWFDPADGPISGSILVAGAVGFWFNEMYASGTGIFAP